MLILFTHPTVIAVDIFTLGLLAWFWIGGWSVIGKLLATLAILLYLAANHWILWLWIERTLSGPPPPQLESGWYKQLFLLGMLISGMVAFFVAGAWETLEHRKQLAARRRPRVNS